MSCALILLLTPAVPACAARTAAPAPCPPCTQQASAAPTAATHITPSAPSEPQYVALQLFVLDTQRTRDKAVGTDLPKEVWTAAGCDEHPCRLVTAPTLLGHRHSPMRLDVGNLAEHQRLTVEALGRSHKDAIDLELVANLSDEAGRHRMEFSGSVTPGGVTHLGTLGREGNGAHEVFAITVHGAAKDAVTQLDAWRPSAG